MISYDHILGTMIAHCDGCNYVQELSGEFMNCIKKLKDGGWVMVKKGKQIPRYDNLCPQCENKA